MTNAISLYSCSARDLATKIVSYFSTILNHLQQEHNTLKWRINQIGDPT